MMKRFCGFAAIALLLMPEIACAHRLDEYLHATTFGITPQQIMLHLRLVPGVDIANSVIKQIDTNQDGILSNSEKQSYLSRIAQGLLVNLNGKQLVPTLQTAAFPSVAEMQGGTGVLDMQFVMHVTTQNGLNHLTYINNAYSPETVWLVNCLVPQDPTLHILKQIRSQNQSHYTLDFTITLPNKGQ